MFHDNNRNRLKCPELNQRHLKLVDGAIYSPDQETNDSNPNIKIKNLYLFNTLFNQLEEKGKQHSQEELAHLIDQYLDYFEFALSEPFSERTSDLFLALGLYCINLPEGSQSMATFRETITPSLDNKFRTLNLTSSEYQDFYGELFYYLALIKNNNPDFVRDPVEVIEELGLTANIKDATDLVTVLKLDNLFDAIAETGVDKKANKARLKEYLESESTPTQN